MTDAPCKRLNVSWAGGGGIGPAHVDVTETFRYPDPRRCRGSGGGEGHAVGRGGEALVELKSEELAVPSQGSYFSFLGLATV